GFGQAARGQPLEHAAHLDRAQHVGLGGRAHLEPALAHAVQQPLLAQGAERQPHRRARDAERLGHRDLGQPRAGRVATFEDQLAQGRDHARRWLDGIQFPVGVLGHDLQLCDVLPIIGSNFSHLGSSMFPMNAWYVACTPAEIDDKPLGRTVCGERIVFYRGPEGRAAALEDWCPHRGAPLSLGRVIEGKLVCGYHGLEMGCDGKAIAMPGQRVRGFPPIRTYPVIEQHGFVWVWPGDASQANADALPHLHWADHPEWAYGGGLYHINADYRLMIDNLMDLTHETYVHSGSIGQPEIDEAPCKTSVEGDSALTSRFMSGIQ